MYSVYKKNDQNGKGVQPVVDLKEHPYMINDVLSCLIIRHAERYDDIVSVLSILFV